MCGETCYGGITGNSNHHIVGSEGWDCNSEERDRGWKD